MRCLVGDYGGSKWMPSLLTSLNLMREQLKPTTKHLPEGQGRELRKLNELAAGSCKRRFEGNANA
jgi:hypothetical protein